MSIRIWENLPAPYRASENPEEYITLWRGDRIGKTLTGMLCQLTSYDDPEEYVYKSLFAKYPNLKTLVKRHTHSNHNSPFISLTDQLALASQFAESPNETVYEVKMQAHRLVIDPPGCGDSPLVEALVIGSIKPADITGQLLTGTATGFEEVHWDRSMSWAKE